MEGGVTVAALHLGAYEARLRRVAALEQLITTMQLRLGRQVPAVPRTQRDYRRVAQWWELEAMRGYPSFERSRDYANNMRWAAEVAWLTGPGTWLELKARSVAGNFAARAERRAQGAA
jgi:hypothetical protein